MHLVAFVLDARSRHSGRRPPATPVTLMALNAVLEEGYGPVRNLRKAKAELPMNTTILWLVQLGGSTRGVILSQSGHPSRCSMGESHENTFGIERENRKIITKESLLKAKT